MEELYGSSDRRWSRGHLLINTAPVEAFNSNELTGLLAGQLTIVLRDASGCEDTAQVTIAENPPLIVEVVDTVR